MNKPSKKTLILQGFSGVCCKFVTVQPLNREKFNGALKFCQRLMIVNPVASIFGNVTHEKVNITAVSPGTVQAGFKSVPM
jgi:hypothetical protein